MTTLSKLYKREVELVTLGRILTAERNNMVKAGLDAYNHPQHKEYVKTTQEWTKFWKEYNDVTDKIQDLVEMDELNKAHKAVDDKIKAVVAQL